jgi:16S rRNA (cytidine1402-2'-O)-methyltransferase
LLVANEHTEVKVALEVVDRLARGEVVAVVSDAGMPAISDPGERLVAAAAAAGHVIEVVPGPSASLTALAASGLPSGRFCFEGFLPRKGAARKERVAAVAAESRTTILYEAPHRVLRTVADLLDACEPDRQIVLARELTKLHEELWRGTLGEAMVHLTEVDPRGEYVLVLAGAPAPGEVGDDAILAALVRARAEGASTRDAVAAVAGSLGVAKRRVYELATG